MPWLLHVWQLYHFYSFMKGFWLCWWSSFFSTLESGNVEDCSKMFIAISCYYDVTKMFSTNWNFLLWVRSALPRYKSQFHYRQMRRNVTKFSWLNTIYLSFTIQLKCFLRQSYIWKIWPEHAEVGNKIGLTMIKLEQIVDMNAYLIRMLFFLGGGGRQRGSREKH